jgi:hypothetical protein
MADGQWQMANDKRPDSQWQTAARRGGDGLPKEKAPAARLQAES